MKRQSSSQIPDFQQIRERLFKIAEYGGGHFFYSDIRKELAKLITKGFEQQAKDIAIDVMKAYTYRPALIWELKQLLSDDEITDFENWRKTSKSNKPKAKCPTCGSHKIARILYGFPMYDEKLDRQIERGTVILGGCCNHGMKYECVDCEREFVKRPIEGESFPNGYDNGKIIIRSENNSHNVPVKS